jgi:hypothetical protein
MEKKGKGEVSTANHERGERRVSRKQKAPVPIHTARREENKVGEKKTEGIAGNGLLSHAESTYYHRRWRS